jgi:hypothetical protein
MFLDRETYYNFLELAHQNQNKETPNNDAKIVFQILKLFVEHCKTWGYLQCSFCYVVFADCSMTRLQ